MEQIKECLVNPTAKGNKFSRSMPESAFEVINQGISSFIKLGDNTLISNNGRVSADSGRSWSTDRRFGDGIGGEGLLRLKSGKIALYDCNGNIRFSSDEGLTWTEKTNILGELGGIVNRLVQVDSLYDVLIQLSDGRLLWSMCMNFVGAHHELKYGNVLAFGSYKGQKCEIEGHGHLPEFYITVVLYSDDEGKTWNYSEGMYGMANHLFGWFDEEGMLNGRRGCTAFGETSVAEAADGRLLMLGRSQVNRIAHACSFDMGKTWSAVLPTDLANSQSPPRLRRIPWTDDLICVWNQVSREEVQRGYRRGRLTAAISTDSGASWRNFKTIELCEGMEDIDRIWPEHPVREVRSRQYLGQLPDGFNYYHYSNICFADNKVYIIYNRSNHLQGIAEQNLYRQDNVMRAYPLEWFYE